MYDASTPTSSRQSYVMEGPRTVIDEDQYELVVHEVHMNRRLDCYTYHNHALNHEAHLWVCDGQVRFQTPRGRSPRHCSFKNDVQRGEITMCFNCLGNLPWKSVVLMRTGCKKWQGWGYASRAITLTKIGHFLWNEATQRWIGPIWLERLD